ncbi:beta-N-acetylhexosaminidase [Kitasatospora sp. MAP12-15]|uniref:glycoside hydrolase family 3 N-terminal domain-containing protein n=1 Tax=unclassified Kitasatospora TaxID=2633591 RepID=UPI0024739D67|nr:glycoside hydrolase family 3 N-terminal domain-containing protein [Kitasatospora sp. MAP12-44]MDH6112889.1 beta-N-acetylhexosaminidase [Kitasatospora sp. MAP12-44]
MAHRPRRLDRSVAVTGLVLLLLTCLTAPAAPTRVPAPPPAPALAPVPAPTPAAAVTAPPLTPEQLAGQRVVYSYRGLTPPPSLLQAIREGRAAGVIFFTGNIAGPEQLSAVVEQLRQAQRESPVQLPLLLMTDQEGGRVRRLPGAPELSAREVGTAADPTVAATEAGTGAAANLAGVGLNTNLAPVLDVYDRPDNFIDHSERSFGRDPSEVAALGGMFTAALQRHGIAATAKHFPGLGTAAREENTDDRPVTLNVPLAQLRAVGEAPYYAAIAERVKLVMLSWAVYPALDPDRPAGLSPAVVQGELRNRLGYRGVTVTDALEAGALGAFGDTGDRAVAAAEAGMDLLLCSSGDTQQGDDAATALTTALTEHRLQPAEFTAAVTRITTLRAGLR